MAIFAHANRRKGQLSIYKTRSVAEADVGLEEYEPIVLFKSDTFMLAHHGSDLNKSWDQLSYMLKSIGILMFEET